MTYKRPLKYPGSKGQTPSGRQSWKSAIKQTEGNLEWSLQFLSINEIIVKAVEIKNRQIRNQNFSSLKKRKKVLENLKKAHKNRLTFVEEELERTENYLDDSDFERES